MPEHAGHSTTDVQRILISMDRLRTERDELRRQMEFVTLELQCAQEQLSKERNSEVQAGASDERVHALSERCSQHMRSIQRLERSALVLASVAAYTQTDLAARTAEAQHASTRCAELEAHSHDEIQALSAALQAAEAERETMRDDIERLEIELDDERMLVEEAHQAFEETRGELDHTLHSLESVEGQRRHLNLQLYDTKVSINETTEAFKDQADQLANLEKELEDVASERNSLRVHLANLERELDTARHELSEGERRYNDLQAQQLAKMSGDAIAMHLKAQIAELEQRISRRTAEKEVLTHDVKRMETNHRLLEERCSEMTNELDTVIMEKDAMIEDCASTREARDEALRRVEDLEMEVERIESRTSLQQQVSEDQFSAMTVVLAEVAVRSRGITAAWRLGSQRHAATVAQAAESLAAAEQERVSLVQAAATAEDHRQRDFQAINEITAEVHRLREEVYDGTINLRATTLALALSAIDQRKQHLAVLALRHGRVQLVSHLATLELGQKEYQSVLEDLRRELDASELQKHESLASMEALRARHEELEGDVASLQQARDEAELANQQSAAEMTRRFAETATLSAEVEKLSRSNDELELRLEDSAVQHSEAMNALQARLSEATAQTDATRAELARVGDDHRRALEDLELAARRAEAAEANVQTHESRCLEIKGQLEHLRVAHAEQMKATEDSLAAVTARAETAEQAQRTMSAERDSAHAEFTHAREVYERHLAEAQSSLEDAVKVRTELEHAQSYSAQRLEDATSALDLAQAQVNQLADELAAERRLRVASDQENALARTNFETSLQNLEAARAEILSQFEHTRVDLQEKTSSCVRLEEQVTSSRDAAERLRLEVNQLRDMHASLESGVSERLVFSDELRNALLTPSVCCSEKLAAAYSIELRELQAELQQTKHALQEAESSLLEHIQALEGQQVEAEAKAALDQALHELQEKYDAQLADGKRMANELEENDDRFIAYAHLLLIRIPRRLMR
jgi:chromosome segregation ATPase